MINRVYKLCHTYANKNFGLGICIYAKYLWVVRIISKDELEIFQKHLSSNKPSRDKYQDLYSHKTFVSDWHFGDKISWWIYGDTDGKGNILLGRDQRLKFIKLMVEKTKPNILEISIYGFKRFLKLFKRR
jgi:hypothetical protein